MLDLYNLTCGYNRRFSLRDITFNVKNSEVFGIIGPNGSGKTTLLRAITKIIKVKRGRIFFEKKDIQGMSMLDMAKKIAMVSQSPDSYLKMKVEEHVFLGRIPHHKKWQFFETHLDEEIVLKAMELTGVAKLRERSLDTLSGGEKQLVFVARALTQEPKLLLLDEPISHLDIAHQVKILDLIKKLNKDNGLTVMIVLHDLNLASEYCDRMVLLNNGSVYKIGNSEEVLTYQNIEDVYRTAVWVKENPLSSRPHIFLVSNEIVNKEKDYEKRTNSGLYGRGQG